MNIKKMFKTDERKVLKYNIVKNITKIYKNCIIIKKIYLLILLLTKKPSALLKSETYLTSYLLQIISNQKNNFIMYKEK